MSVHQESLDMSRPVEREKQPPTLEYNAVRNDSLTMFGAAIGGAVLGVLLTLLILAIINGGTLSFTGGARLDLLEANVDRINANVGAVSYNVDLVAQQAQTLQAQLATVESTLGGDVAQLQTAVDTLNRSTTQFIVFLSALNEALSEASAAMEEAVP